MNNVSKDHFDDPELDEGVFSCFE